MTFAHVLVWLHRAELPLSQLHADFANCLSSWRALGKLNEQAIRELVACFVPVDVGHDHFDRACFVKCLNKLSSLTFYSIARGPESSQQTRGFVVGFLREPFSHLAAIWFLQERTHKNIQNVFFHRSILGRQLGRLVSKSRQRFILRRRFPICVRADNLAAKVESFGEKRPIAQPHTVSSGELTAHGRDFELKLSVVVPLALDACAVNHFVFAEQATRFIPLTANTVQEAVAIRFFRGAFAVLVPDTDNPMPAVVPHGHSLADLSVSIKCFLDGGAHVSHIRFYYDPHLPSPFNTCRSEKPIQSCSQLAINRRGADSTRPHERHCEAPLRETRQAAPDWARASAALSSSKNSQFSRGTRPLRRKSYGFVVMSSFAAHLFAEVISNKFHRRLQPLCEGRQTSRRPATIPRDENLEAKPRRRRKAQGGTEATTRSILELSTAAIPSTVVFIAVPATSRMARQVSCNPIKISERRKSL